MSKRTLLAVLAHPDDETFGTGGTLALYAHDGVDCYLVCATRGEVGEVDAEMLKGFNTIAERREHELRCAAEDLGLKGVYFLGYRDSGMPGSPDNTNPNALAAQPVEKVAGDVVHYIRLLKPQVVITFDPIGGYYHPDHIAIHNATVEAFAKAGEGNFRPKDLKPFSPNKLYFQTISRRFLRIGVRILRLLGRDPSKFGKNGDIDIAALAKVEFPIHARVNYRSVASIREQASACHESQGGREMARGFIGLVGRLFNSHESYMRAFPEPLPGKMETDLFEGILEG